MYDCVIKIGGERCFCEQTSVFFKCFVRRVIKGCYDINTRHIIHRKISGCDLKITIKSIQNKSFRS